MDNPMCHYRDHSFRPEIKPNDKAKLILKDSMTSILPKRMTHGHNFST